LSGVDAGLVLLCVAVDRLSTGPIPSSSSLRFQVGVECQKSGKGLSKDPVAVQGSKEQGKLGGIDDGLVLLCVAVDRLSMGRIPSSSSLRLQVGGGFQRIG
jgi:hypothetical protein